MAKKLIGLDIGHWSIKMTALDLRDHSVLDVREFQHQSHSSQTETQIPNAISSPEDFEPPQQEDSLEPHPSPTPPTEDSDTTTSAPSNDHFEASAWISTLRRMVDAGALQDAEAICCNVPANLVTFVQVPVPFDDEDKVGTILPSLLSSRLTKELSHFFWSFYVEERSGPLQSEDEQPFQARVAVIEREELSQFISDLHSVGVDPSRIVFAPILTAETLIFRSIVPSDHSNPFVSAQVSDHELSSQHPQNTSQSIGFLDLGYELTTLTVVQPSSSSSLIETARTTCFGISDMIDSMATELLSDVQRVAQELHDFSGFDIPQIEGMPTEEEFLSIEYKRKFVRSYEDSLRPLVRDIRRTLQGLYAHAKTEVVTLYLLGGGAHIRGMAEKLSELLGVKVAFLPTERIGLHYRNTPQLMTSWALSQALVEPILRRHACNFRHGAFQYRGKSSYLRKQIAFGLFALVILALLVFGILYAQKASMQAQRDAMKAELAQHTKELFGAPMYEKKKIQMLLEGKGEAGDKGLIPTQSAFELGYNIVSHMPGDIDLNISKFEVDTRRSIAQIRGDTTDAQAVDRLVSSLEEISCLKDIKKERLTLRGSRTDFELQINTEGCS